MVMTEFDAKYSVSERSLIADLKTNWIEFALDDGLENLDFTRSTRASRNYLVENGVCRKKAAMMVNEIASYTRRTLNDPVFL